MHSEHPQEHRIRYSCIVGNTREFLTTGVRPHAESFEIPGRQKISFILDTFHRHRCRGRSRYDASGSERTKHRDGRDAAVLSGTAFGRVSL